MFADRIGATTTVAIGGIGCLLIGGAITRRLPAIRAHIRPIYAKLGITVD
jgi:hypothetical protein